MEQLTQKLKNGETKVLEVPFPQLGPGMVLVRNHYSIISAGTEGATAHSARKSLLAKVQGMDRRGAKWLGRKFQRRRAE